MNDTSFSTMMKVLLAAPCRRRRSLHPSIIVCLLVVSAASALLLRNSPFMSLEQPGRPAASALSPPSSRSTKTILAVRHGTSTANDFMRQPGNQWGDPNFYDRTEIDAPLSQAGREQVRTLLRDRDLFESVELVLVSPLRRCLQTYLEGVAPVCPAKAVVLPLLRERVYTQSDTSQYTLRELSELYPSLDWSEALKFPTPWHYTGSPSDNSEEWRPHDKNQWYAVPGEPLSVFEERMNKLDLWLRRRPEKTILLVSHWGVLRHFTSQETGNCHVVQFEIE